MAQNMKKKARGKILPSIQGPQNIEPFGLLSASGVLSFSLIEGENQADYETLRALCLKTVKPADIIEEIWLHDFINYTWELERLKKIKAALFRIGRQDAVHGLINDYSDENVTYIEAKHLSKEWSRGDLEIVGYVDGLIAEHSLGESALAAKIFEKNIMKMVKMDKLIAAYSHRRDRALRELENRRELLARRARDFAEGLAQDAEVITVTATE